MKHDQERRTITTSPAYGSVTDCNTCGDKGFVRIKGTDEVVPCPNCNEDGMDGITG